MNQTHELKTWPLPFRAIWDGQKRFEFRRNDRQFRVGDTLRLREWDQMTGEYSGQIIVVLVTYIANGENYGIPEGYCVMSLTEPVRINYDGTTC